jgi:methylase of polypeptide subunit release factors
MKLSYACSLEQLYAVEIEGMRLAICKHVYVPAEDSWLALSALASQLKRYDEAISLCIDVGAGTGVLGLHCAASKVYTVLTDINPCAVACSLLSSRLSGVRHLVDIVQCDAASCIRKLGRSGVVAVYNTPYLPEEEDDKGLESLAWSGGLREAERFFSMLGENPGVMCGIAVYSSLSGDDSGLLSRLAAEYIVEVFMTHVFFEDIKVVVACRRRP